MSRSRRIASPAVRVFGLPLAIGVASAVGLVAALVGDGLLDALSWLGLGVPVAAVAWAWRRRR